MRKGERTSVHGIIARNDARDLSQPSRELILFRFAKNALQETEKDKEIRLLFVPVLSPALFVQFLSAE